LNLNEKISIIHGSALTVSLPHIRFDIILAEGIFNIIGFKKSIVYFSKFLKTNGWFMIHDDFGNQERKLRIFEKHHLKLVNSFILDEKVWWNEYYGCLEKRIMKFTNEITHNLYLVKNYKRIMSEIKMYKKNPMKMRSMYFILKKM
jgi:hypothetical protein